MIAFGSATFLLLAVPALAAVLIASRASTRKLSRGRRIAATLARGLTVALLTMALARPVLTHPAERPGLTVFLADVSDSVPRGAWAAALPELAEAWEREIAAGNRCALVAFAGGAEVMTPPTREPLRVDADLLAHREALARARAQAETGRPDDRRIERLREWTERLRTDRTAFDDAVRIATALFDSEETGRLVVVTDGRATSGPAGGIDLPRGSAILPLDPPAGADVAVVETIAPLAVRSGEPFDLRVTVRTTSSAAFRLLVSIDDVEVPESAHALSVDEAGVHGFLIENLQQSRPLPVGLHRIGVLAEMESDVETRNNSGGTAVTVTGRPRVLILEGAPGEGLVLEGMLRAQDIDLVREGPERLRDGGARLEEFVAVVLAGCPPAALEPPAARILRDYVEASGGGLFYLGSKRLAADGALPGSAISDLLPVLFLDPPPEPAPVAGKDDPAPPPRVKQEAPKTGTPKRVLAPTVALLLVVDKSGSMAGQNITLVKEACIESARTLTSKDLIGVLAFDAQPRWVLPFVSPSRRSYIEDQVLRLYADGGTNIHPALLEALVAFRRDPGAARAGVKHVVLLSDGDTRPADFNTVIRAMNAEGVTVSTVCVGSAPQFNALLMKKIAAAGKGRFLFTNSFRNVPQIFVQETKQVLKAAPPPEDPAPPPEPDPDPAPAPIPEPPADPEPRPRPVEVRVGEAHETLQGLRTASFPNLLGILPSRPREGARTALVAAESEAPVLAFHRVGLGKVAAWTSDLSGNWSPDWVEWPSTGKLFAQVVRHIASAAPDAELANRIRVTRTPSRADVRIAPGAAGQALYATDVRSGRPLDTRRDPGGEASVEVPFEAAGEVHPLRLYQDDGKNLLIGVACPVDPEFAPTPPDHDLRAARPAALATWSSLPPVPREEPFRRTTDLLPWLVVLALLLIPVDVAMRRIAA